MHSRNFDKCIMTYIHHYNITQNSFTALQIPRTPPIHPSPKPLATTDLFKYLHSFIFSRMSYSWNHTVCSHFRLPSFTWQHSFRFPMSFQGLIVHFFLLLNNIPLSVCTTVCISIHLSKDILIVSKFWQLRMKLL